MSKFKHSKIGIMIPAGQSRVATRDQFKQWFTDAGWQVLGTEDVTPSLTVALPSSEMSGNARGKEAVRINFNASNVLLRPLFVPNETSLRSFHISASNAASPPSIKIGATTFTTTKGADTNASTRNLYDALSASSSAETSAYNFSLVDYGDGALRVVATEKSPGTGPDISAVNYANVTYRAQFAVPGTPYDRGANMNGNFYNVTVDYGQGWVLYAGWFDRTFTLATRTLNGFYGPVSASFLGNAEATAQAPSGSAVAELVLVHTGVQNAVKAHFGLNYGYAATGAHSRIDQMSGASGATYYARPLDWAISHPFSPPVPDTFVCRESNVEPSPQALPGCLLGDAGGTNTNATLFGAGGLTLGNISLLANAQRNSAYFSSCFSFISPSGTLADVYSYFTSETSETAHVTRKPGQTLLAVPLDASATSLRVTDPNLFNATGGTVIIGSEVITYSGLSGDTLTGLTRGFNGTSAQPHTQTEAVNPGFWFIKVNAGAVPTGETPPA